MKIMNVRCMSFLRKRTGRDEEQHAIYGFESEMMFGRVDEGLNGGFSIHSKNMDLFTVGNSYKLEINTNQAAGKAGKV